MARPIAELGGPITALFSDLDGTLTTRGRVEAETYTALERLGDAGVPVILVTGRPAGWGQGIASVCPVAAVVTENGGVTFVREGIKLKKIYGVAPASLPEWRRKMRAAAGDLMSAIPGAQMSSDSKYREVDLAIDWNEEAKLSRQEADQAVAMLRELGFTATRSSVHINFGPPSFDKLTACRRVVELVLGGDPEQLDSYAYVGDSLNDAPMFAGFGRSIGVANIKSYWEELTHRPAYLTESEEGVGLREVVARILELRGR